MSIILRPVGQMDLCVRFARDMGNNHLKMYTLTPDLTVISRMSNDPKTPFEMVCEYIKTKECDPDTDIQLVEEESSEGFHAFFEENGQDEAYLPEPLMGGKILAMDISTALLKNNKSIGRALTKRKIESMIYEYHDYPTVFHRYAQLAIYHYNNIAMSLNKLLYKIQGLDYGTYNPFAKQLKISNKDLGTRRIELVKFLSISFEENDLPKAAEAMLSDLKVLNDNGLIMGHLSMPKLIKLADMVGAGRKYYAMFCFPIVNNTKLLGKLGLTPLDDKAKDALKTIGVKYETPEGSVSWLDGKDSSEKYSSEIVYVSLLGSDGARNAVIQHYEETRDTVNSVAKKAKENLDKYQKLDSKTEDFGAQFSEESNRWERNVKIDVNLLNKETGEIINPFKGRNQ